MPPNRLTLALLCSPRTRSPTLGHRRALSGPARSASGLSALFPRRERPTHVTRDKFSVWGGVSRGTGRRGHRALQGPDPIRTVQESTQQGARRARGLSPCAVASPAAMTRELRATAPPGRAVPSPRSARPPASEYQIGHCGMLRDVSLTSRATRTPKRRRAKTPTRTAGRPKTLKTRDTERRQSEAQERRGLRACTAQRNLTTTRTARRRLTRSGPRARFTSSRCVAATRTRRRSRFAEP